MHTHYNHLLITLLASFIIFLSLTSCKELLDNPYDPNALHVEVTDGYGISTPEDGSKATRATYTGFTTTFDEGDAIGVYVYDGTKYVASNVKFTKQSDGSWLPDGKIVYNPSYTYYAYFPYSENAYTPSTSEGDVETKFADFISDADNNFWKADQSSKANFTASNLMLSSAKANSDRTLKFTMKHARGLAIINVSSNTWSYSENQAEKYPLTPVYTENIPYQQDDITFFLMKPDSITTLDGIAIKASSGKYAYKAIKITSNPYFEYSVSTDGGLSWSEYSSTYPQDPERWYALSCTYNPLSIAIAPYNIKTTDIRVADASLQAAPIVSDVDLSMVNNDGTAREKRETANCYLVHAAGTYKVPLVYGNAIKNGVGNSLAYHPSVTNSRDLLNHNDEGIYTGNDESDPWIKNHGITIDGAKLIWQDSKNLITEVGIDGNYLTFTVGKENISEGNAVIAATSSGTVVWSWHIWVTSETLSESDLTTIDTGSHTYKVAPVNVGQVEPTYQGLACRVKAFSNGITLMFEFHQPNYKGKTSVSCPYYQWGRKDAEPPSSGSYDMEGNTFTLGTQQSRVSIGTTIQNPGTHYYNSKTLQPSSPSLVNLWDINKEELGLSATATIKTIYDPCPPGYCVPTGNLNYYMAFTGGSSSSYGKFDYYNHGYIWIYNNSNLFFPFLGYRNSSDDTLKELGKLGYVWSASTTADGYGYMLMAYPYQWIGSMMERASALPVRPVLEE